MKSISCLRFLILIFISLFSNRLCISASNILAVEFIGTKSHALTYLPLLEELSRSGHNVTLLSPLNTTGHNGIREILTVDIESFDRDLDINMFELKEKGIAFNMLKLLTEEVPKFCEDLYEREDIKSIMGEPFDLVILQPLLNECAYGLIHKVTLHNNAPLILFTPLSAPSWIIGCTGGYHPPSFVPSYFSNFMDEMTFWERMKNFGIEIYLHSFTSFYYIPRMEEVYREKLGEQLPCAKDILSTASIILSNGHFSINRPKPNFPHVIDVGGIHSRAPQPLSKDLETFIQKSGDDGFILFSFGSRLRGDQMSEKKREILLNAFGKLKQGVIWKFESQIENIPQNVMLQKWLPQQDLLGHARIKIFITHCGLGGIEEAIFHGVPLLGIPFVEEQKRNANEAENQGILLQLDWNMMTEESLLLSINTLLNNHSYSRSVTELSSLFKDQIDSPLERAVWWTEYILRNNGAPKLQSPARKLHFVQYHSLDVITAYVSIFTAAACILWKLSLLTLQILKKVNAKYKVHNNTKKRP